jgi:hypothetical protein
MSYRCQERPEKRYPSETLDCIRRWNSSSVHEKQERSHCLQWRDSRGSPPKRTAQRDGFIRRDALL